MFKSKALYSLLLFLIVLLISCQKRIPATELPPPPTANGVGTALPSAVGTTVPATYVTSAQHNLYLPLSAFESIMATATSLLSTTPTAVAALRTPTTTPTPTAPPFPAYEGPPLSRNDFGLQIHLHGESLDQILYHLEQLNVGWVKVQVSWKLYEPKPGEYDEVRFRELDHLVSGATGRDIKVLLSVAKAPEWSRATTELDGPPQDPAQFQSFMHYLANRYRGNVAAYELWNEPNLQREWNGAPLSAEGLVQLIRFGAAGVRAADDAAIIISGAPATTGINDGIIAIDDRVYMQEMLVHGVGEVVDAVGVHPYGWANPPDASASDLTPIAPSHNNHPSFFFADTIRDYRSQLDAAGFEELPLWVTEFGWGTFDGMNAAPPSNAGFMSHVSEWQQAEYILRAYEMAHEWSTVGPMFLWNLNFAPTLGADFSESGYSVLRADGRLRPAYYALQTIPKE